MNLKTFFNFNFLKENIRKSKGILAFLLGIIPVINIIYLVVLLNINHGTLLTFNTLSFFTYFGILFIPLGLSLSLFSFIFKKASVDFILSKPVNRKSIYITNTIGGILLILLFVILNTFIFGIFGLLFSELIIPFKMLIDYFIFWLISYIFIFLVLNLAMVIAGNMITSLVISACVILFVPFLQGIIYLNHSNTNYYLECNNEYCDNSNYYCYGDKDCEKHLKNNEYEIYPDIFIDYHFTAPLSIANNNPTIYDTISVVKMLLLSTLYSVVAYFIFKRRKMENNETSFKSSFIHLLVKGITLLPISFIAYVIIKETDFVGWLIAILAIIVYSVVYDLITRKEIYKPVKSTIVSLILFLMFTGVYHLNFEVFISKEKVLSNIDKIVIEGMDITDDTLKKEIIASLISRNNEEITSSYDITIISNNNRYDLDVSVNSNIEAKITKEYLNWQENKIKNFPFNETNYIKYNDLSIPVTSKIKKLISDNIDKRKDFDMTSLNETEVLTLYSYQNHEYQSIIIPIKISNELYKEVLTHQNEEFIKYVEENNKHPYYTLNIYNSNYFTEEDAYLFDYVINSNQSEFIRYLKYDNNIDISKESIVITIYDLSTYSLTISDASKFKEEFASYKKKIENEEEYKRLLDEYTKMNYEEVIIYDN